MIRRRDAFEYCACVNCCGRNIPLARDYRTRIKCSGCKNVEVNADCFKTNERICANCLNKSISNMLPPTKKQKVTHTEEAPVSAGVSSQYVKRRHSGTIIDYVAGSSDEDDEDYDPVIDEDADPDDCKGPKLTLVNDYDVTIASSSKQKSNTLLSYFTINNSSSSSAGKNNNSNNNLPTNNSSSSSSAGKNNNSNNNLPKSHHSDVLSVSSSSDDDVEDDHVLNDDNLPELSIRARERSVKIVQFKNHIKGSRTSTGKKKIGLLKTHE